MIRRWDKSKPPTGPFALNLDCPQARGLVAWYPMGMAGKNYAADLAGNNHAGLGTAASAMTLGDDGRPALSLVAASNQYLAVPTCPKSAVPLTLTAWAKPPSGTQTVIYVGATGGTRPEENFCRIVLVSGYVRANFGGAGPQANAITTVAYTAGAWSLFSASFTANNSRTVYLNGANAVTETTSITPGASFSRIRLGVAITTSEALLQPLNGDLGECGIWDVSLDASMHARLYSPATRFELWYPLRSRKWISIAAATAPTITALSAISITATSAQPQITYA